MNLSTTVLFVDDELAIRESIENVLRKDRRVQLITADGGPAALALLEERQGSSEGDVAVLISDYQMPGMNGLELMDEVRRRYPMVVRILLSARIDLKEVTAAFNRGQIYRFLAKPCPPEELSAAVHSALRQSHALAQSELLLRRYEELKAQVDALGRVVIATGLALRHDSQASLDGEALLEALTGGGRHG